MIGILALALSVIGGALARPHAADAAAPGTTETEPPPEAAASATASPDPTAESATGPVVVSTSGRLTAPQIARHREAAERLFVIVEETFAEAGRALRAGEPVSEASLRALVVRALERDGLVSEGPPVVAVGAHAADPAYLGASDAPIRRGDLILLNVHGRGSGPDGVYADLTWMAFAGRTEELPKRVVRVWDMVIAAREAALERLGRRLRSGDPVRGEEVDEAARRVVRTRKHEPWYLHPTGHSLDGRPFGGGPDLKPGEERLLGDGLCFTVEPGVYYPHEFGVRSEVNVCMEGGKAILSGTRQQRIRALFD